MASNCSALDTYKGFTLFVDVMRSLTSENLTVDSMQRCRTEICSMLYGTGNADISGIGVVFGYFIQLILGILLSLACMVITPMDGLTTLKAAIRKSYLKYGDAALMLSFSIQVAAVVIGAKKNFGISAVDFGSLTIRVTFAASLLTILPMLLVCAIPAERTDTPVSTETSDAASETRDMSLFWTALSWLLFLFTFVSRMLNEYSSGQVGSGKEAVISDPEAANIWNLCFRPIPTPSAWSAWLLRSSQLEAQYSHRSQHCLSFSLQGGSTRDTKTGKSLPLRGKETKPSLKAFSSSTRCSGVCHNYGQSSGFESYNNHWQTRWMYAAATTAGVSGRSSPL